LANQAKRLSSRLLMLLMLKVAILTESRCVDVPMGARPKRSNRSALFRLALFYRGKEMESPELKCIA
jgi:hypothetical protein